MIFADLHISFLLRSPTAVFDPGWAIVSAGCAYERMLAQPRLVFIPLPEDCEVHLELINTFPVSGIVVGQVRGCTLLLIW